MARIALSVVGFALGGPLGAQIGNIVGGLIDNQLFPIKQEGPRLTDLTVQASTYGNSIPLMFGPYNRMTGNIIWSSGLLETKHKQRQGKGGPAVVTTTYTYRTHLAVALGESGAATGEIVGIRKIWANNKVIYDAEDYQQAVPTTTTLIGKVVSIVAGQAQSQLFSALRVYPGNFSQDADPTIESYKGVGNTPAYRGTAYVVLVDFQLADYGNRLPNLEFLVEVSSSENVASVVDRIVSRAGIDTNTISSALLVDEELKGYVIATPTTCSNALQPLELAFHFDAADQGGNLRCIKRGSAPRGVITIDDLGGQAPGEDRPEPLHWTRDMETQLPRQASITFADPDRDFQPNTQTSVRTGGSADSNLSTQVALVLSVPEGQAIADRMLWEAWNGRQRATGIVTDRWMHLLAGYVYLVDTPAGLEPLRITNRTRGANGLISFEASRDFLEVYSAANAGVSSATAPNLVDAPGNTLLLLIDAPILFDSDDNTGFYYFAEGTGSGWRGGMVFRSSDGGSSYGQIASVGSAAILGTVATATPAGPTDYWDRATSITVTLDEDFDGLESLDDLGVLNGGNAAWLGPSTGAGGEIIQFRDAVEISSGVWTISTLLRGRAGTEYAASTHGAAERFVLLDPEAVNRSDFGPGDWNKARLYKPVSLFQSEADATGQSFTNTGEGKRPYAPVHITGSRDGSDNLTIDWFRRTRLREPGLGNGPVPLGESVEAYEIDVLNVAETAVLRTITASTPTAAYSAADQTTDGLTPGDPVHLRVYQISDTRGRGHAGAAIV